MAKMFLESKGNAKLVGIAEKLKHQADKVRMWKPLDGWEKKLYLPSVGYEKNKWSVPLAKKGNGYLSKGK